MQSRQNAIKRKKSNELFWLWFFLNTFLWISVHTLVGFVNFGLFGLESMGGIVGFISGIVAGFFIGLIQWIILSRNFSVSLLWILSTVLGFSLYYTINWYTGVLIMGALQQFLIKKRINDPFLWGTALFAGVGMSQVLTDMANSPLLLDLSFYFSSIAYSLPQGILLVLYKRNSSFDPNINSIVEADLLSHKFGVRDLLSIGWQIYRSNFKNILILILCAYIPINIILSFFSSGSFTSDGLREMRAYNQIFRALELFIGVIATIGIAQIVNKSFEGEKISWVESLKHGFSRWLSAIGTSFLAGLIIAAWGLLLIIPGIVYSFYYSFWVYIVALRYKDGKNALDYSKKLIEGQWWRIFGILLFFDVFVLVLGLNISLPFYLISENQIFGLIPDTIIDIVSAFAKVTTAILFLNNDFLRNPQIQTNNDPLPEMV